MKNKNELFFILLIIVCAVFFISGCYVVAKVNIHAAVFAGCSLAIYLLSPAAANINIESKVVKIDHP
jgi:hypothetical protein